MSGETAKQLNDPFSVGQLVGMMVILTYIEENDGISKEFLDQLKNTCAEQSSEYLKRPAEDVFLLVDNLVKDIKKT